MPGNASTTMDPLGPSCPLRPQPPLLSYIPDRYLAIILPTIVYIIASAFFHWLDSYDLLSRYRIHPSEEVLKRNHVSRAQCLRQVVGYHAMQIGIGLLLTWGQSPTMIGDETCKIRHWADWIKRGKTHLPTFAQALGLDTARLTAALTGFTGGLTPVRTNDAGLSYPSRGDGRDLTTFDIAFAKVIFYLAIPAVQYFTALAVVDTWIYFTHRLCHINKTLYRIVHARHHLLYVSYAYGAVYGHPLESFFLDILSFVFANNLAQLTERQSMLFGSLAVIKTISDHCGYVFPLDPFLALNANGARFHDLHHQSWGLKSNFSTYTTFWDNLCGTSWSDEEGAKRRYERVWSMRRRDKIEGPVHGVVSQVHVQEGKEE